MSEFRVNSITNKDGSAGPQVCGLSTFSGKSGVQIPSGSSDFRRQDGGGRGRGIFDSGATPSATNVIDMVEIATTGDAVDFGMTYMRDKKVMLLLLLPLVESWQVVKLPLFYPVLHLLPYLHWVVQMNLVI